MIFVTLFFDYLPRVWEVWCVDPPPIITEQQVAHAYDLAMRHLERPGVFGSGVSSDAVGEFMQQFGDGQNDIEYDADGASEMSSGDSIMFDLVTDEEYDSDLGDVEDEIEVGQHQGDDDNMGVDAGGVDDGSGGEDESEGDYFEVVQVEEFLPPMLVGIIPEELFQNNLIERHTSDIVQIIKGDDIVYSQVDFAIMPEVVFDIKKLIIEFMTWAVDHHKFEDMAL